MVLIGAFAGSLWLFERTWRRDALADLATQPGGWMAALVIVIGSAIVHEAIHALGWRVFGRVPWRSMSVRPSWRGLGIAADPGVAVSATAHRVARALPALMLGGAPVVVGLATGRGLFVLWGLFLLFECFTDIAVLFAMWAVAPEAMVVDTPDRLGYRLVSVDRSRPPD
jgi:hypothetical protein